MTSAEYKRTRIATWKQLLEDAGGTSRHTDTLYQTVKKCLIALGGTPSNTATTRSMAVEILQLNPTFYSANGKRNGRLLPSAGAALAWGTDPSTGTPSGGTPAETNYVLQDDGSSYVLQDDGTSKVTWQ